MMIETRRPRHSTEPKNHQWTGLWAPVPSNHGEMTWGDSRNAKKAKPTPLYRSDSESVHISLSRGSGAAAHVLAWRHPRGDKLQSETPGS